METKEHKTNVIELLITIGAIVFFLLTLISAFFYGNFNISYLIIFLILQICIFGYWSKTLRAKYSFKLNVAVLFITLHFIIFPLTYTYVLNEDILKVDKTIHVKEKKRLLRLFEKNEKPKIETKENDIDFLLRFVGNEELNRNLDYLIYGNIIFLDKFTLTGKKYMSPKRVWVYNINFCDSSGKSIFNINSDRHSIKINDKQSIDDILKLFIRKSEKEIADYGNTLTTIETNHFWKYHLVLPYSMIFFYNQSILPKSRYSEVIIGIHIITLFLLGGAFFRKK